MVLELVLAGKLLRAEITLEWFLTSVHHKVLGEIRLPDESFSAKVALERLLPDVDHLVLRQVRLGDEPLRAEVAFKRLLSRMHHLMFSEVRLPYETFTAGRTTEWLVFPMAQTMVRDISPSAGLALLGGGAGRGGGSARTVPLRVRGALSRALALAGALAARTRRERALRVADALLAALPVLAAARAPGPGRAGAPRAPRRRGPAARAGAGRVGARGRRHGVQLVGGDVLREEVRVREALPAHDADGGLVVVEVRHVGHHVRHVVAVRGRALAADPARVLEGVAAVRGHGHRGGVRPGHRHGGVRVGGGDGRGARVRGRRHGAAGGVDGGAGETHSSWLASPPHHCCCCQSQDADSKQRRWVESHLLFL